MKRFALILGSLLMVGCAQDKQTCPTCESGQPAPTAPATPSVTAPATPATPTAPAEPTVVSPAPTPVAPAAPTVVTPVTPAPIAPAEPSVVAPAVPAAPAVVAKPNPIFEMTQDNKIYVFASVQAMTDFSTGKVQPTVVEKPNFTPGGRTLVLEAADPAEADAIFASYNKLHPVAK